MGCFSSKVFVINEDVPGQGADAAEAFRDLDLSVNDINKLYKAFKTFDVKDDDGIEISEFLVRLKLGE